MAGIRLSASSTSFWSRRSQISIEDGIWGRAMI